MLRFLLPTLALLLATTAPALAQRPPTPVIVDAVVRESVKDRISIVGQVRPKRGSLVASESQGVVVAKLTDSGRRIRRGDVIFRLDNDRLRAGFLEAKADLELRQFNHDRTKELFDDDVVPEQQMKNALYELARARSKYRELEDGIDKLAIRAPYDGHVIETLVELGEWVDRGDQIARIISTDTIRVYINVPEVKVADIAVGDEADLFIDAIGTDPVKGRVVAVLAEGYGESHTFPVVVETANPGGRIRSNMAARAELSVARADSVTLVHKDAVITSPFGSEVFLAIDGKAVARTVTRGLAYNGYVAIQGDLSPGDLVIVRGNERLQDGQPIKVLRQIQ